MTPPALRHFRIFVSSPDDVREERAQARAVIREALASHPFIAAAATLEVVMWDDPEAHTPLDAVLVPQASINKYRHKPSECDIAVFILWSRIGTRRQSPETTNLDEATQLPRAPSGSCETRAATIHR